MARPKLPRLEPMRLPDHFVFSLRAAAYIKHGDEPDREFVQELLRRYVELAGLKKWEGNEIAAMVDYQAIRRPRTAAAIRFVAAETVRWKVTPKSESAVKDNHDNYGLSPGEIKKRRAAYRTQMLAEKKKREKP